MAVPGARVNYTELHLHTSYSLLDGLNTPEEYMKRASELGMTHLAITDHGVLSGHREFQKAAKDAAAPRGDSPHA